MRGGGKIDPTFISRDVLQEEGATGGCEPSSKSLEEPVHSPAPNFIVQAAAGSVDTSSSEEVEEVNTSRRCSGVGHLERSQSCDFEQEERPNSSGQSHSDNTSSGSRTQSASSDSAMEKKTIWKSVNGASTEISRGTMRVVGFFKRKLRSKRGKRETAVKEIHISPEEDEERWACRSASGNSSGNNSRASSSTAFNSRESTNLEVVHDMDDEYNPEYR